MTHLFGTDGIRGLSGQFPLISSKVKRIAECAGQVLTEKYPHEKIRVLGVRDTRASGAGLFSDIAQGLRVWGIDVYDAGVLSTPAVAHLVHAHRFHSGFVISASHNPPEFNGIKFFNSHGRKWADEWEKEVELLFDSKRRRTPVGLIPGLLLNAAQLTEDYADFLSRTLPTPQPLQGLKLAVDCSNGANSHTAPALLTILGARIYSRGINPNGKNINVNCGSQETDGLKALVAKNNCHAGIAFDGDGDRVIFVDEKGGLVDGDHMLLILSRHLKYNRRLKKNITVITVMANLGLRLALKNMGINVIETPVGDRHVSEAMRLHGSVLGGEQSGHVILGEHLPSGDGLLTALHILSIMKREKKPLSALAGRLKKFPQVLLNMTVRKKIPLSQLPSVEEIIRRTEKRLKGHGRVLVRYSGTEPLLRIMLEGPHKNDLETYAREIAAAAKEAIEKAG